MRQILLSAGIAVFVGFSAFGQGTEKLQFDVASVKPAAPPPPPSGGRGTRIAVGGRGGPGTQDPTQITWSNMPLKNLLTTAYDVKPYQVTGPSWLDSERYDIVAKVPEGTTKEQSNVMLQNLLAQRFGVVIHHESKEFQVQELTVGKNGSKVKETTVDPNAPLPAPPAGPQPTGPLPGPPKLDQNGFPELAGPGLMTMMNIGPNGPTGRMVGKAQPLSQLANFLGNQLNQPVVDKTGLTGKYDFAIEYTPDLNGLPGLPAGVAPSTGDGASEPGSNLASAIQQQLGLKLSAGKAKLDVVVVDKAEKVPTDN